MYMSIRNSYTENYFFRRWRLLAAFAWWIFLASTSQGQSLPETESYTADTNKVNALIAKSSEYIGKEPTQAIKYNSEAKVLAEKIGFTRGAALATKNIGNVHYTQGQYLEAINYWTQSLEGYRNMKDLAGVSNILNNIGVIHSIQGDYQKALENYLEALKAAEQSGNKKRIGSSLNNVGATYALKPDTYNKALQYYLKALELSKEIGDTNSIGTTSVNLGEVYSNKGDSKTALQYFQKSLKAYQDINDDVSIPYTYNAIAKEYKKGGKYDSALHYHQKAYTTSQKVHMKLYMVQSLIGLANIYTAKGDASTALDYYKKAENLSKEINAIDELKDIYLGSAAVYARMKNYRDAYKYQMLLTNVKDTIYNIATDKKLAGLQFDFDLQKKQSEINLLTKDKQLQELNLNRQKMAKNILLGSLAIAFIIAIILYRNYRNKIKVNRLLDRQNAEIESLILNILPEEVAQELQKNGNATPRYYESASVLFTDFKNFSKHADALSPQEVVNELNECFVAFDEIIIKYNLEKIKTIGDSYMCAGGIPTEDDNHYINIIKAALEIRDYMEQRNRTREAAGLPAWDIRIGVNTGSLVAGVVGRKKYAYDIWGGTVNVASRMESNGEPGKVNISAATYEFIKHKYNCKHRGKIMAKNIGEVDMYFVENEISDPSHRQVLNGTTNSAVESSVPAATS